MEYVVRLIDGLTLVENGPEEVSLKSCTGESYRPPITLSGATPALIQALKKLSSDGESLKTLIGQILREDGTVGIAQFNRYIQRLTQLAALTRTVKCGDRAFATLRPLSPYQKFDEDRIDPEKDYTLSRFAWMRNRQGRLILECPLGHAEIELESSDAQRAVCQLVQPTSAGELNACVGIGLQHALAFMNLVANAEALVCSDDDNDEANDPVMAQWDFHDLAFHTRCRMGRHANPYGGTWPFKGQFDPLPTVKPRMSETVIDLDRPNLDILGKNDLPFTHVLEKRASIRKQGTTPISKEILSEFLFRVARIKAVSDDGTVCLRPYPSGGGIHELEIYPLIHRCDGLSQGLYQYNALDHQLCKISGINPSANMLLRLAGHTATLEDYPQVLFVITARFQRMQMKYQSVTYSVIMKNVGALYQTMYLVATAMGLAPCALGGGHADLFADTAGLNYYAESSVGEFILGSQP